ncbi:MAG: orotidine-5'-phosphate decarboxylase [Planctomycetota bacterium]
MTATSFAARLDLRLREVGSPLCVGIDPRLADLPREFRGMSDTALAFRDFGRALVDLTAEHAAAFKLQAAFFEVLGAPGVDAYEDVAAYARASGALVVADCKRGDIGSTAAAYARAAFALHRSPRPFDAITVNPYFGDDGLRPFFETARDEGGGVFVLVKTSNPSSRDFQDLELAAGGPLYREVARRVAAWSEEFPGVVGAVVGATHGALAAELRAAMPRSPLLVPGVGAQGATADDAAHARDAAGGGTLVNLSRGIARPWTGSDAPENWRKHIADAARHWSRALGEAFGSTPR